MTVGLIAGGINTNVVPDRVTLRVRLQPMDRVARMISNRSVPWMSSGTASLLAAFCCLSQTRKMLVVADGRSLPSTYRNSCLSAGRDQLM